MSSAYKKGKRVLLISDMYLPETVIVSMLQRCGINDYEKLYVSNTYGENKLSGKLFQIACKDWQIDLKSMIHIGDSIKADMIGAHKAGIHVWLVGRKNRIERLIQRI